MASATSLPVCVYNGTYSDIGGAGFYVNAGDLVVVDAYLTQDSTVGLVWVPTPEQQFPPLTGVSSFMSSPHGSLRHAMSSPGLLNVTSQEAAQLTATVWRAPSPWRSMPRAAYPVGGASGTCSFSLGDGSAAAKAGLFSCAIPDGGAGNTRVLRAGLVRSGAVLGDFGGVDAQFRSGTALLVANASQAVVAQHGYLVETLCPTAASCRRLFVRVAPAAVSKYSAPTPFTLGWAFYEVNGSTQPLAPASAAPTLGQLFKGDKMVTHAGLLGGECLAIMLAVLWSAFGKKRHREKHRRVKEKAADDDAPAKGADDPAAGDDAAEGENVYFGRRRALRSL